MLTLPHRLSLSVLITFRVSDRKPQRNQVTQWLVPVSPGLYTLLLWVEWRNDCEEESSHDWQPGFVGRFKLSWGLYRLPGF